MYSKGLISLFVHMFIYYISAFDRYVKFVGVASHKDGNIFFHWIRFANKNIIYPITKAWSGLERGYGIFLNDVSPEQAAEKLGAASRKELANLVGII